MPILETITLKLAGPAVALLAKAILPEGDLVEKSLDKIEDIIDSRLEKFEEKRKAKRLFEDLQDEVAKRLTEVFKYEFPDLNKSDFEAAVHTAGTAFKNENIAELAIRSNLDASALFSRIFDKNKQQFQSLGGSATLAAELLLRETCAYISRLADSLPDFQLATARELLVRSASLAGDMHRVLDAVVALRTESRATQDRELRNFETTYRRTIVAQLDRLSLFGVKQFNELNTRYPLSVAYVSLRAQKTGLTDGQSVITALTGQTRLLIKGEAGTGKTTLMQWLAVRAAQRDFPNELSEWNEFIPIYIRLREFAGRQLDFPPPEDFLARGFAGNIADLMPKGWAHQIMKERALLLLDGFDELPASKRSDFNTWLSSLCEEFLTTSIVVSSRPAALDGGRSQDSSANVLSHLNFGEIILEPLSARESEILVDQWHQALAKDVTDTEKLEDIETYRLAMNRSLRERPAIRNLASTPLLCAMLCALNWHLKQRLPDSRMILYQTALEMLLDRRDEARKIGSIHLNELDMTGKQDLLDGLALWMLQNGESETSEVEVLNQLELLLRRLPNIKVSSQEVLDELLERSGVLRRPQHGRIDFIHRTFLEFMGARAAVNNNLIPFLAKHAKEEDWREVIVFAVGHARGESRDKLMEKVLSRPLFGLGSPSTEADVTAVCCLETSAENLAPHIFLNVMERANNLFPPSNLSKARLLAPAARAKPELLEGHDGAGSTALAGCIRCAALVGGPAMLSIIEKYAEHTGDELRDELFDAWTAFDMKNYRERVVSRMPWIKEKIAAQPYNAPPIDELLIFIELLCARDAHRQGIGSRKFEDLISTFQRIKWLHIGEMKTKEESESESESEPEHKQREKHFTHSDAQRLRSLKSLEYISIATQCDQSTFTYFKELENLTDLNILVFNQYEIDLVSEVTQLKNLRINSGFQKSIPNSTPLEALDLNRLDRLQSLEALEVCDFESQTTIRFPSWRKLPNLKKLTISFSRIDLAEALNNAKSLTELNLTFPIIQNRTLEFHNLTNLSKLTILLNDPCSLNIPASLQEIDISGDIYRLTGNTSNIQSVSIYSAKPQMRLDWLLSLPNLKQLDIRHFHGKLPERILERLPSNVEITQNTA